MITKRSFLLLLMHLLFSILPYHVMSDPSSSPSLLQASSNLLINALKDIKDSLDPSGKPPVSMAPYTPFPSLYNRAKSISAQSNRDNTCFCRRNNERLPLFGIRRTAYSTLLIVCFSLSLSLSLSSWKIHSLIRTHKHTFYHLSRPQTTEQTGTTEQNKTN